MKLIFSNFKNIFAKPRSFIRNYRTVQSSVGDEHSSEVSHSAGYPYHKKDGKTIEPSTKQKLLRVAVIGAPNAGKSSFINSVSNRKVNFLKRNFHIHILLVFVLFIGMPNISESSYDADVFKDNCN